MRFDSYHPVINLIYFVSAIAFTIWFHHPVFLVISYVSAFLYSVKLNGKKALIFNLCLIPLAVLFALYYASYHHFGITNLRKNFIGNEITLESLVYGLMLGVTVAAVIMFFSCMFAVVSSDKVVYLFGRISPSFHCFCRFSCAACQGSKREDARLKFPEKGSAKACAREISCRDFYTGSA